DPQAGEAALAVGAAADPDHERGERLEPEGLDQDAPQAEARPLLDRLGAGLDGGAPDHRRRVGAAELGERLHGGDRVDPRAARPEVTRSLLVIPSARSTQHGRRNLRAATESSRGEGPSGVAPLSPDSPDTASALECWLKAFRDRGPADAGASLLASPSIRIVRRARVDT